MDSRILDMALISSDLLYEVLANEKKTPAVVWMESKSGQFIAVARPPFNTILKEFCENLNKEISGQLKKLAATKLPQSQG